MEIPARYLARRLGFKHSKRFDQALAAAGASVKSTALRASSQTAFVKRWSGSLRGECLNRLIAFGLGRLDHLVTCYQDYYHQARPHQRKDNKSLLGVWTGIDDPPNEGDETSCRQWPGGVL